MEGSATPAATATGYSRATFTRPPTVTPATIAISRRKLGATLSPPVMETATRTPTPRPTNTPTPSPTPTPLLPTPHAAYSPTLSVPILMYHYINEAPAGADIYREDLSVSPLDFRAQMAYLAEEGFNTIDLYDLILAVTDKRALPSKPVILTFDDGYVDAYLNAYPILEEFDLMGNFFIPTEFVDRGFPDYMSWEMIEEMSAAGHRMESHSKTHPDLRGKSYDDLIWELLGSQETLAAHIGYTPRFFVYPSGRYEEATIEALRELDFWGALTTAGGKWHSFENRYEWARLRMRNTTVLAEFISMVTTEATE